MKKTSHIQEFTVVDPRDRATLPPDPVARVMGLVVPVPGSHYRKPSIREGRVYCSVAETPLWMDIAKDVSNPIACLVAWTPVVQGSLMASQLLQKIRKPTGDKNHGPA
jgi:hypothetical protein